MEPKRTMNRRTFLKAGVAGLGVAALGSVPARGFGQAPAVLRGTRLTILQVSYFIPAAMEVFKKQAEDWGRANGVTMAVDFLNSPDLQPKMAAAVYAGGLDIVNLQPAWNYLYKDSLVDLSTEAEEFGRRGGGYEPYVLHSGKVGDRWLSLPVGFNNYSANYRISWFKEAGVANAEDSTKLDMTWDEYHAVAKKCKAAGHPFGLALGHSPGDPPNFCYPYMWAHGAMEVEKDGKTVAFNKPEFVDAMRRFIQAWKDGYDETGLAWDDSANNRAFLAGQITATLNGSSIYFVAKKEQPLMAQDMNHLLIPRGPAGRFYWLETSTLGILKNSKNISAAREFLKWWFQDEQYNAWFRVQDGYQLPPTKKLAADPVWLKDPKMTIFRDQAKYGVNVGFPGPPSEKAALAVSKYIVVDTFARAVQSGDAKAAIDWGTEQLKRIYT